MNKFLFLAILISAYGCNQAIDKEKAIPSSVELNNSNIEDLLISTPDIYNISFEIDKQQDTTCYLYTSIELFDGAYFMSPTSNLSNEDSFSFYIEENKFVQIDEFLEERPPSIAEYDSIFNEEVHWVKENTTFKWKLLIKVESDFEVSGKLQFRIQPQSHFEEIDYIISQQSGKLNIYRKGHNNKVPTKIMQIRTGATVKGYNP